MFFLKVALLSLAATVFATTSPTTNPYATFPPVPRTATYNGFADRIYDDIAECAQACVEADTGITPCPYWDTGCLCVMSMWGNGVANCIAENCRGSEVETVTSLASSACSVAGVPSPYWFLGGAQMQALASAAAYTAVSSVQSIATISVSESSATSIADISSDVASSAAALSAASISASVSASVYSSLGFSAVPPISTPGANSSAASSSPSVTGSAIIDPIDPIASVGSVGSSSTNATVSNTVTNVETVCPVCTNYPSTYTTTEITSTETVVVTTSCEVYVTTDSNGEPSTYTSEYDVETTVITVTSCHDNICSAVTVTGGQSARETVAAGVTEVSGPSTSVSESTSPGSNEVSTFEGAGVTNTPAAILVSLLGAFAIFF